MDIMCGMEQKYDKMANNEINNSISIGSDVFYKMQCLTTVNNSSGQLISLIQVQKLEQQLQ